MSRQNRRQEVLDLLFGKAVPASDLDRYVYQYENEEAIQHLFMVASSLDSMIVGEAQILGQLKEAYRYASEKKTSGLILNKLLHKSFFVAKRVRTETQDRGQCRFHQLRRGGTGPQDFRPA